MNHDNKTFGSKLGVIAATVGSAIGLGNIWRFPAETQTNGGAAFLFVYIICVFLLGIPAMIAEMSLGRAGRSDSVGNFKNLTPNNKWWITGIIGLAASYLILSFYMVVAGWTIEYLFESITGHLYNGYAPSSAEAENAFFSQKMATYITTTWNPLIWTFVMIAINLGVLLLGVRKGIEKMSNVLMPLLFLLMLIFCATSLTLPNASEGVSFFLNPDFSKINAQVVINALGQAFFSLSLGMGILVTYSAYYPNDTKLGKTAVTVSLLDFIMALLMGLIIFPAVKSFGIGNGANDLEGTTLVFVTLPEIFPHIGMASFWATLFFLLLGVAALTSTISLGEVAVAFVRDRFHMKRTHACFLVICPLIITSALCSLSLGAMPQISIFGTPLFNALDTFATNILLPLSALCICIYVGWRLPKDFIHDQLTNFGTIGCKAAPLIAFLIKWICPVLICIILISSLISL